MLLTRHLSRQLLAAKKTSIHPSRRSVSSLFVGIGPECRFRICGPILQFTPRQAKSTSSRSNEFRPEINVTSKLGRKAGKTGVSIHPTKTEAYQQDRVSDSETQRTHQLETNIQAQTKPEGAISNDLYTIPNLLTYTRIITTPFAGYFIATGQSTPAIAIFTYSCITDLVDGYIARRFKLQSVLGSIIDPAADKFLMFTCTIALSIQSSMPLYVASMIIGRDVILSFVSFYIRYRSLPPPKTLRRFLDMSITTHTVNPNLLGKINTGLQMFYIGGLVLKPAIEAYSGMDLASAFDWYGLLVATTTLGSGLTYLLGHNSFKAIASKATSVVKK